MNQFNNIAVMGAGGFIGGALVSKLLAIGSQNVRGVDVKPLQEWYQLHQGSENIVLDLQYLENCKRAVESSDIVINLAADMGGMGFIETHKIECMLNVLINTHLLQAAEAAGVETYFFASSACVYAASKQQNVENPGLKESDAYPAMPEDGYGWEKLFSERLCVHFNEGSKMICVVNRFHNVYGPHGSYEGGREKAPAAICRKIAEAQIFNRDKIEIWGDGKQTRSFMYIDDCVEGILKSISAKVQLPINLGSSEMVSIDEMVSIIEGIAGLSLKRTYNLSAPTGVRGRSSDNTLIKEILDWEPSISLRQGLEETYRWVRDQIKLR